MRADVRRGDIWWASLRQPRGSEPGYRDPILVLQADSFNRSSINTVLGAVITSNLKLAEAPGNVRVGRRHTRLPRDSVVNVSRIVTIDRRFLIDRLGRLSQKSMAEVEAGLRLVLDLGGELG